MSQTVASSRPGMGAMPFDGGVTFRVWAPHAEGVSVAGTFCDWDPEACPWRRGGWHLVGGRDRRTDRRRVPVPRARWWPGALAHRSPGAPADEFRRQRRGVRPGGLRLGHGRVPDAGLERPGHLRAARGHLQRGHARPAGHARGGAQTPRLPARAWHRRHPADAALRVRRRPFVGLQPGLPVRGGVGVRPP